MDYLIWKCVILLFDVIVDHFLVKFIWHSLFFTEDTLAAILSERSHLSQFDVDSQQLLYLINLDLAKD